MLYFSCSLMTRQESVLDVLCCTSSVKCVCTWCSPASCYLCPSGYRGRCLWQTVSQAIWSHVPASQIWAAFQVTYCNAALHVGMLPAWHACCACSWEGFPLAGIAGLCPRSWVPARTMTWKAKWDKLPLLHPLHLG